MLVNDPFRDQIPSELKTMVEKLVGEFPMLKAQDQRVAVQLVLQLAMTRSPASIVVPAVRSRKEELS